MYIFDTTTERLKYLLTLKQRFFNNIIYNCLTGHRQNDAVPELTHQLRPLKQNSTVYKNNTYNKNLYSWMDC